MGFTLIDSFGQLCQWFNPPTNMCDYLLLLTLRLLGAGAGGKYLTQVVNKNEWDAKTPEECNSV